MPPNPLSWFIPLKDTNFNYNPNYPCVKLQRDQTRTSDLIGHRQGVLEVMAYLDDP